MEDLPMEETSVGFRFYPTEEELISFYLRSMLQGRRQNMERVVPVVNVFDFEPSQLPKLAGEACKGDGEQWFFMVPIQEREARGSRPRRTTGSGYWKATGSASYVYSTDNRVIGVKKTMVFYIGRAPIGRKTNWKINEYKATDASSNASTIPKMRHEFSLCRVYVTSGSSRAFDRRPMEAYPRQAKFPRSDGTATEKAGSSETSYASSLPEKTGQSSSDMVDGLQQPFWEWEKLK